jgi:hypothetical protein
MSDGFTALPEIRQPRGLHREIRPKPAIFEWHDYGTRGGREVPSMKRFIFAFIVAFTVAIALATLASADQPSQSAAPAASLKALLEQFNMDTIAARDPDEAGRYIAAMYVKDSQLLVVSAPYRVPTVLDRLIAAGNYMEAYLNLQAVADHRGHYFIMDSLADGLRRVPDVDQPFDSTTVDGAISVTFDGKWNAQKLTEAGYNAMFAKDDTRYARMLTILANELRKKTTVQ